jgi:quinol monooxygenase YgiN
MSLFSSDKTSADSGHINVIAVIQAKSGHEASVRTMLEALVLTARDEDGCKGYHLHEDKKHPGSFYTYEEWTSEAHLDRHLEGAKPALDKAAPLFEAAPRIIVLEHLV